MCKHVHKYHEICFNSIGLYYIKFRTDFKKVTDIELV